MAALSMQGRSDADRFIPAFTGSHRFVLDYLVEDVLQRQPERIRNFLLRTSILEMLCGPLCDAGCFGGSEAESPDRSAGAAVSGRGDGRSMLEALERANLFIVPLDNQRQWYRYHHLFTDVLRVRLMAEQPVEVPLLHQRACEWYEQNGLRAEAIRHALAGGSYERAADLIELAHPAMDKNLQPAVWLGWAKALPDKLVRDRPVLSADYPWAYLDGGELEAAESWLVNAERWLQANVDGTRQPEKAPARMVVVDEEQFRLLSVSTATARAYRALTLGDVSATIHYARQALNLLADENHPWRVAAFSLLWIAQYASGDLLSAERSLGDFQKEMLESGEIITILGITFVLVEIRMVLGRLRSAANTIEQALQLATRQADPMPVGAADLYRGLSELYCAWGDLKSAGECFLTGKKLGEQASLANWQYRLAITEARIKEAQGDLDGALAVLNATEGGYIRSPLPDLHPLAAVRARLWIRQGRLGEALDWARATGRSVDEAIVYPAEFELITLARVLIAQYKGGQGDDFIHQAVKLLERLLRAAEAGGRNGSLIEVLLLLALAHQAHRSVSPARRALKRALALAEPEGYVQIFLDEGESMDGLLLDFTAWIKRPPRGQDAPLVSYADRLLSAFTTPASEREKFATGKQEIALAEPLSERELEVLRLLRSELSGPDIARQLMVSLSTIRTHTQPIYSKLGVNNRQAAVRCGEELDLLS